MENPIMILTAIMLGVAVLSVVKRLFSGPNCNHTQSTFIGKGRDGNIYRCAGCGLVVLKRK